MLLSIILPSNTSIFQSGSIPHAVRRGEDDVWWELLAKPHSKFYLLVLHSRPQPTIPDHWPRYINMQPAKNLDMLPLLVSQFDGDNSEP